ncbi:PDZ domain-containing protein [Lentibacillus sp. JNUCC-1]|uniref:PDZ domain-containing protein n=1 Tax=Lentibacillus sp. JNUCC-1 TaxID=2654513 RepID=UPI0012E9752E|nr:PDZ domain-containing protein [Lentibacillus sp. JNUCC-1]
MLVDWGIELLKGVGRLFLNPLLYWAVLLVLIVGLKRHQRDRRNFGMKIFGQGTEVSYTILPSLIIGAVISLLMVGVGVVFSYQTLMVLAVVVILLSVSFRLTLLSASYTIGVAYIVLLFLPLIFTRQSYFEKNLFSNTNFVGLAILLGVFLIVEGIILKRVKKSHTYPDLMLSERGGWIGQHHLGKMAVIPFFTLIPAGAIEPFAEYWPYVSFGGDSYGLLVFPFIIGFDYAARGSQPEKAAEKLAGSIILLGFFVLLLSIGSVFAGWLSAVAIVFGIVGKEWINYRHRVSESSKRPYFPAGDGGLTILDIIPDSPAERLDIIAGDHVKKVNGQQVASIQSFYEALQGSGAFFKLELIDTRGEVRFVQGALYEGNTMNWASYL